MHARIEMLVVLPSASTEFGIAKLKNNKACMNMQVQNGAWERRWSPLMEVQELGHGRDQLEHGKMRF